MKSPLLLFIAIQFLLSSCVFEDESSSNSCSQYEYDVGISVGKIGSADIARNSNLSLDSNYYQVCFVSTVNDIPIDTYYSIAIGFENGEYDAYDCHFVREGKYLVNIKLFIENRTCSKVKSFSVPLE